MSTLETIPSRMRIVILDACRNNPFPEVNDAGRGLAIVDAPNGSIVGYSTAPGAEALDGTSGHSPYTQAFLNVAREPNVPIEQLFKRVRLQVNQTTSGAQIPWESSSLTSDFTFFGDTVVAANRAPVKAPVVQMAANLPGRSTRQAYDYVVSEGRPEYYQEFIQMYPHDPLCDHVRWLLKNLLISQAWHKAVLANSPLAYKSFYDSYGNSPYAQIALKLQAQPKQIPLMQATKFLAPQNIAPTIKIGNLGQPKYLPLMQQGNGAQVNGNLPVVQKPLDGNVIGKLGNGGQIVTLPAPSNTSKSNGGIGKIVTLPATNTRPGAGNHIPGKIVSMPVNVGKGGSKIDAKPINVQTKNRPIRITNGNTGIVKPNSAPVKKVQVLNNRPQFNAMPNRMVNSNDNFRQSMNQAPNMNGGGNRRGGFMR
jgi:hypothetical protein